MQRPDVEKYEALAGAPIPVEVEGRDWLPTGPMVYARQYPGQLLEKMRPALSELCAYTKHLERKMEYHFDQSLTISGETRKQIDAIKSLLRDWLAACPETCGQYDDVRKRAEEAVR